MTLAPQPAPLNQNRPQTQADWQQILNQLGSWQQMLQNLGPAVAGPTTAESTVLSQIAGSAITDLSKAVGNVLRYGAQGTGQSSATVDTLAFQTAAAVVCLAGGVIEVPKPPVCYVLTAPIFTGNTLAPTQRVGVKMRGTGQAAVHQAAAPYDANCCDIVAAHTGVAIIDNTGGFALTIEDLTIGTDPVTFPQTGLLAARSSDGNSQLVHTRNFKMFGTFSTACYYNYGSEDDYHAGANWQNVNINGAVPTNAKCVAITGSNYAGLTSPNTTIATGSRSSEHHVFDGGVFNCAGSSNAGPSNFNDMFYLESCDSPLIIGAWGACGFGATGGRSYFFLDTVTGNTAKGVSKFKLKGFRGEDQGGGAAQPLYGVAVPASGTDACIAASIEDCYLPAFTAEINAGSGTIIDSWVIRNITSSAAFPRLVVPGTLQACVVEGANGLVPTIGTSSGNSYTCRPDTLTMTSTLRDTINPAGPAVLAFTPNISALSGLTGSPSATGSVDFYGKFAVATVQISGVTGGSVSAGQQITGLPALARCTQPSADVQVVDTTSNAVLGAGVVATAALAITLTAFTATSGHIILVTAVYQRS